MGERMKISPTALPGVMVVETSSFSDQRGTFARLFCEQELAPVIQHRRIVQINQSCTHAVGAIRGLHYQRPPHAEMKLVCCLKGRVWDVAVDLRAGSPSFLKWHAEEISPGNAHMMVIPEGCAHGFQVLESHSELLYLHTAPYEPGSEDGVRYNDPAVNILWPLAAKDVSERDATRALLGPVFKGIAL